jgi:hypothetical protein
MLAALDPLITFLSSLQRTMKRMGEELARWFMSSDTYRGVRKMLNKTKIAR